MVKIYLVPEGKNQSAEAVVEAAVGFAFPGAKVEKAASVDAVILQAPSRGTVLVVHVEPLLAEVKLAAEATHLDGRPRFAQVIMGGSVKGAGSEIVPEEEWNAALLKHVLRGAVERYELAHECAQLRGDLYTMARRISHDLRSPLTGIFTTAELLREILSDHSPEDTELTKPLFDSAQAQMRLIDRVSFLGKATIETKEKEPVDMGKIIWNARQGIERLIVGKNGRIEEPSAWPEVNGVETWLEVVWTNLLGNAFLHGGATPQVKVGWDKLDDEYRFWVRDNGPDVPKDREGTLFTPFHRLHGRNSGQGVGLSIVHRLVSLQGGNCGYEPAEEGQWKTFYFTLPDGDETVPITPLK